MGNQINAKQKFVDLLQSDTEDKLAENLKQILLLDINQEQYLSSFFPPDIRDVLKKNPERILGIISFLHNFLCVGVNDLQQNIQYRQWKNSLRILTSIFPLLYEEQFKQQMLQALWLTRIPKENEEVQDSDPPLIISLMKRLINLCFTFGFTIDTVEFSESIAANDTLLQYFVNYFKQNWNSYDLKVGFLWKGFNSQCKYQNDLLKYYENRYLVLSCIQAIVSQTLFEKEFYYMIEEVSQIQINPTIEKKVQKENQIIKEEVDNNEIKEEKQFQEKKHDEEIVNEQAVQKVTRNFLVQIPNTILMAILKIPLFPELLVSLIAFSFFSTERIKEFLKNITNIQNQLEINLQNICITMIQVIVGGQNLVFKNGDQIGDKVNLELKIAKAHFDFHNCFFPQLISLPEEIQESILSSLTAKFYSFYQSQQQFIRGAFEKQLFNTESHFHFLCLLAIKTSATIPNLFKVLILTYFYPYKQIKKLSLTVMKQISISLQMNKQLSQNQEFTIPFTDTPLIIGTWGDLLITTLCTEAIQNFTLKKDKLLNDISIILFNIAQDVGKLNETSSILLCKLIQLLANYDYILKSPFVLSTVTNLIGTVSQILYYSSQQNQELLFNMFQIHKSFQLVIDLKVTVKKLELWYNKHVCQNPVVNRSFIKIQQNNQNDVQEIRDSQVRSITQPQAQNPRLSQLNKPEELQSLNNMDQVQSERTQKYGVDYKNYLMLWKQYDYEKVKQQQTLQSLNQLINWLKSQKNTNYDRKLDFGVLLETRDVKLLMGQQTLVKVPINQFECYKKITKYIWLNFLRNSGKFPYFEKSECQYFGKYFEQK